MTANSKDADYEERTCSFLAAGGNKKKSNDLGSFDGKQMYRFSLTLRLDAKLLLQQLVCLGISRGQLAVSFFSTLLHNTVLSLSTSSSKVTAAQSASRAQLFAAPWTAAGQAVPQSLLGLMSTE